MSTSEETPQTTTETTKLTPETKKETENTEIKKVDDAEEKRSEKILLAKDLYSQGSRNFLVKNYGEAADQLSEVCALYAELYGELSAELGMPYLLYAKSLIALALGEIKLLDVPDEADDDDDDEEDEEVDDEEGEADEKNTNDVAAASTSEIVTKLNGTEKKPASKAEGGDADTKSTAETAEVKSTTDAQVSSSSTNNNKALKNGNGDVVASTKTATVGVPVIDDEKPSTSNGDTDTIDGDDEEENEATSNLQLAWEILESAAKIFSRQGFSGLPNLAEVQTELANIEFENNIMDAARDDYEKALRIYQELPKNYHRAMAEIHYKIGLTYLMEQLNKEGAASLKQACDLIEAEITDIKSKDELTEKDKNNIQDMEETKQEIRAKIDEIEETQAQNIAEVRAALDSYIKPIVSQNAAGASTSSSAAAAAAKANDGGPSSSSSSSTNTASSSKPTDITHLIKRKKPDETATEAEASPAKRPAV